MTMLEAAIKYIQEGFRVFPVKPDKTPLTPHGSKDATMTATGAKEYWTKYPDAGVGLVTDGFIVFDFDFKHNGLESRQAIEEKYGLPQTRIHLTGGGGFHYIYKNPNGTKVKNAVAFAGFQGFDIRGNDGYIVAPPSPHLSGNNYQVYDDSPIAPAPEWYFTLAANWKRPAVPASTTDQLQLIPDGQRNSTLLSLAGKMRRGGFTEDAIAAALLAENTTRCQPPLDESEVLAIAKSIKRYQPAVNDEPDLTRDENRDTIPPTPPYVNTFNATLNTQNNSKTFQNRDKTVTKTFQDTDSGKKINYSTSFDQVLKDAGHLSRRDIFLSIGLQHTSDIARQIVKRRLKNEQIRFYRGSGEALEWINRDYKVLSLADYRAKANLAINLPLDLNKYVHVPAGSVIGVAGYTSAGKTAFQMEICELNITQNMHVYYWFNEMSEDRMLLRLEDYPALVSEMGGKFKAVRQTDFEFYDVIDPDGINVIDYLDMDGQGQDAVYMIGAVIKKLQRRLEKGIVVFALQKQKGSDMGYGGIYSAKLSNLYLSLDTVSQSEKSMLGKCKIVKAKDWDGMNPVGMYCNYYTGGKHGKIISDNLWRRGGE